MSIRLEFVHECLHAIRAGTTTTRALCAVYGISEKTGYKWLARFEQGGAEALVDRTHTAARCPHRTPAAHREAIIALRLAHPGWGARKLRKILSDAQPTVCWPAPSTITTLLAQDGLVVGRRPRRPRGAHPSAGRLEATAPNTVWTADYKGEFKTQDGQWCWPLTVVDAYSRYLLGCVAHPAIDTAAARAVFTRLFQAYGLPTVMRTDNGAPFAAASALRRLSRLSVWWLKLGIVPERITPGRPQENGRHERFHRTLKAEATRPPERTRRAQQRRFDAFRTEYNELRPHEALQQEPPARHYTPSLRPWPARLSSPEYPSGYQVRRVSIPGMFHWRSAKIFLTSALAHEPIGLTPHGNTDGLWDVYFSALWLGTFDERTLTMTDSPPSPVSPIHPV
jgi:putative transposase